MTASQPTRRHAAGAWRTVRRAAAALRAIHDEQVRQRRAGAMTATLRPSAAEAVAAQPGRWLERA